MIGQLGQNNGMQGNLSQENIVDSRAEPGFVMDMSYSSIGDQNESNQISEMIKQYFDHPGKDLLKKQIIHRIRDVVDSWMVNINVKERKIPEDVAHLQLARVLAFGSYYLEVSSIDGDVDLVCIAPNFVDRQRHFHGQLFELLCQMEGVTYENNVMDAKVPILKFEIEGIPVDISFAQLDVETLPDDLERDIPDKHLRSMDERDRTSINGYRCNQLIMKHVMESSKDPEWAKRRFKDALKCIKIWARNNGIYENRLGFLGGISWALMLAKMVQMFPNVQLNRLLEEFFSQYSKWNWTTMEIALAPISQLEEKTSKPVKSEMCIYTPAIPEYNSTERVKKVNMEIIVKKIKEGNRIVQEEIKRGISGWERLLRQEDFLNEYSRFIEIDLIRTQMDLTMREFQTQQDKLSVKLLTLFEMFSLNKPAKLEIRPWPTFYKKVDPTYPQCQAFLIGLKATGQIQDSFKCKKAIVEFANSQQKSLESLTHCMIRIFQATRGDLTDIVFIEESDQEQLLKEQEIQKKKKLAAQSPGVNSNSINAKRVFGVGSLSENPISEFEAVPNKKIKNESANEEEAKNQTLNQNENGKSPAKSQKEEECLDDYY